MKLVYHLVAALVGLAIAALIVYVVFGNASQEGARQDGSAGELSAEGSTLCGTVSPADARGDRSVELAGENLPSLFDQQGPIAAIADDKPEQQRWVARVHAASGLCLDEIRIEPDGTTLTMSTVEGVSADAASRYAAAALAEAFTPPFNPPRVTLRASVDGSERIAVVSRRAWGAFQVRRKDLGQPLTMQSLSRFRAATSFRRADIRVRGWG